MDCGRGMAAFKSPSVPDPSWPVPSLKVMRLKTQHPWFSEKILPRRPPQEKQVQVTAGREHQMCLHILDSQSQTGS